MSTTDLPGSSLLASRYRLVERLGAGGMSVVWRGFDEVLGRQVAVKVLPPSTSADPAFRRRLRAEAQAAARLSHPNITNVYDYGEATTADGEPVPYVVMELIDGESLAAVLARARRLPWQHAVRITAEVAAALAAAHSRGIVHRDVTPANVMLTQAGAKVVDFGISALIGENDIDPDGSLLGTPAYLAPERLEGGQVSPATDVYAVGLLIYRTLIGQLPWDVGTTTALLRAHQYTEPDPLPPVEGMPPAVAALVGRCLEKRPADRPSSAELAHVLAGISANASVVARGYVPDWSENGDDTTILPSQRSYTDVRGRAMAAAGVAAVPPPAAPPVPTPAPRAPEPPAQAPDRNSRFAALKSGPVMGAMAAGASAPLSAAGAAAPQSAAGRGAPPSGPGMGGAMRSGPLLGNLPSGDEGNPGLRPAFGNEPPTGPPGRAAGPAGPGPGRSGRRQTRRVLIVAGAVVALALGTYGWSLANPPSDKQAAQGPVVVPPSGKCVVSYAVWTDANGRFKAEVTVANRADTAVTDWKLWFIMPGDQVVRGDGKMQLTQDKHTVTVSSDVALKPQKTLTLPISGRYVKNNAVPQAFELNKQTCETYVSSKPGEPSKKVEHLSDGKTRLAPTPATSAPGGGIQIGPGGVVKITPTTAPTTGPTTGPTTVKTDEPTAGPTTDRPEPSAPPTKGTTAPTTAPTTSETSTPPPGGVAEGNTTCVPTEDDDCQTAAE